MMTEAEGRATVIDVARSWISTPFHDVAGIKGVGVDCAHLIERVYTEAGVMDHLPIDAYSPQWFLHREEEKFLGYVLQRGREISESDVQPGDMAIFKFGRCYSHGAIIVDWPGEIIHALKLVRCVISSAVSEYGLRERPVRFFSLWT